MRGLGGGMQNKMKKVKEEFAVNTFKGSARSGCYG